MKRTFIFISSLLWAQQAFAVKICRHIYNRTCETWKIAKVGTNLDHAGDLYVDGNPVKANDGAVFITPGTHDLHYTSSDGDISGHFRLEDSHGTVFAEGGNGSVQGYHYFYNTHFKTLNIEHDGATHNYVALDAPSDGDITLYDENTLHAKNEMCHL